MKTTPWLGLALIMVSVTVMRGQSKTVSLGIFTGATSTFVWDEGVNKDPRYETRYDIKSAPIGVSYGIDYEGYGFVLTPSVINIGQKYNVINTVGGQEGIRSVKQTYFHIPAAFKAHIIDLSFFKVSFVGGASVAFLLNGKETISHRVSKLRFPSAVHPILPPEYEVEYDGVVTPSVSNYMMLNSTDFSVMQIFVAAGFCSDWDVSENWRVSFDLRGNYGLFEPRSAEYIKRQNSNLTIYDVPGTRRDIFVQFNIGIARYIDIDKKDANRKKGKTSSIKHRSKSNGKRRPRG